MENKVFETIKNNFNNRIAFREKEKNVYQIIAPFYHEDGDMYNCFLQFPNGSNKIRICDYGSTLTRLSYTYDLDTPKKEEIFNRILQENMICNDDGNLFLDTDPEYAYNAILRFTQVISKVTNMEMYRREVIKSLFYEDLHAFIQDKLKTYNPIHSYFPILDREDLEVDICFDLFPKKLFLFGVKDNAKARLVSISCLEYLRKDITFRSIAVHENFDDLSKKDRNIITNIVDKQYTNLKDFETNAEEYLKRESA